MWKRVVDVTVCMSALPLLAATTAAAGILATITSPGPIIYRQECIGRGGRRFALYRMRTLHISRESVALAPQGAGARHRPYFPGGRLLQATRLAELPRIINVLRGETTLFGPAPRLPGDAESPRADGRGPSPIAALRRATDRSVH